MSMEAKWNDHVLEVTGDWTWRWLFMAPIYELRIDGECVDRTGGPRVHPRLEAVVEDDSGRVYHLCAELVSLLGYKPACEINVDGEVIDTGRVRVQNFLNPFLVIFILVSVAVMVYLGPAMIGQWWSGM